MAPGRKVVAAAALAAAWQLRQSSSYVPPPPMPSPTYGVYGAVYKDPILEAADNLADASYDFLKDIDWNSYTFLLKPGPDASAADWAKAVDKMIVMGASVDPVLLRRAVDAHHKAISGTFVEKTSASDPVIPKTAFVDINAAIGKMIASVPESQVMDVYNSVAAVVSKDVGPYMMSTVDAKHAKNAYEGFMKFKDVVKKNPIKPSVVETPEALSAKLGPIDEAAQKLSKASYPFIKDIDWSSDLYLKPIPGVSPQQVLKGPVDKMLVMGASMDGKLLQDAAKVHHKALTGMDAKLVASEADYTAINAAIGKLVASVPSSQVLDVYNSVAKLLNPAIANNLISTVSPNDANAAYTAFLKFKDAVKAAR